MSETLTKVKRLVKRVAGKVGAAGAEHALPPALHFEYYTRIGNSVAVVVLVNGSGQNIAVSTGGQPVQSETVRVGRPNGVASVVVFAMPPGQQLFQFRDKEAVASADLQHEHAYVWSTTMSHEVLGSGAPGDRLAVLAAVGRLVIAQGGTDPGAYRGLLQLRAGMRRKSYLAPDVAPRLGAHLDMLALIGGKGAFLRGWAADLEAPIKKLMLIAPDGQEVDVLPGVFRYERRDVAKNLKPDGTVGTDQIFGFVAFAELPAACPFESGWELYLLDEAGNEVFSPALALVSEVDEAIKEVLGAVEQSQHPGGTRVLQDIIDPAIRQLMKFRSARLCVEDVRDYGHVPKNPHVSVIVPLYKRIDFLEHQLAQFTLDPEFQQVELIYVLDSPELLTTMKYFAESLYEIYRVPFRLVMPKYNSGYSMANNFGVQHSTGRNVLLLNSDVLPEQPGWLSQMVKFFESTPGVGAVGPMLLYEDDTLQHAGMYWHKFNIDADWANWHYFKGLHRTHKPANETRVVPAVTGACLLTSREIYDAVGGLHGDYVFGDYEDSDMCLRIQKLGKTCWYWPAMPLYHLEGQSYPSTIRTAASRYNQYLHTKTWGTMIQQVMDTPEANRGA